MPKAFDVPGAEPWPVFAVTDFAVTRGEGGRLAPKLIELQAFPTLYGFQVAQNEELAAICPSPAGLEWYLSGLDAAGYKRIVGEAILAGLPPENVVLLDLDPPHQKTAIDFVFTEQIWGVRAVDPGEIEKRGRELWYRRNGKAHANPPDLQPAHLRRARGQGRHAALRPRLPGSTCRGPATPTGTSGGPSTAFRT